MAQEEHHTQNGLSFIVVGGKESGKTSVVSILLGHGDTWQGQRTVNCVKYDGQLMGKNLIVVDTPGWWKDYSLIDTAARTKHELLLSVQLCPPGPHAFLLTVEINNFIEKNRRSVEEHLGLFGEKVWDHTIVVFTRGESLKYRSIEQHIEREGVALKWLVEKCGNRYCVYSKQTEDPNQVTDLLKTIVNMVMHSGRHFELDENILKEVEKKKRAAEERARARQQKVEQRRIQLREKGQMKFLSEIRMVILGWVICGKSLAKNVILNKEDSIPPNKTEQCQNEKGKVDNRHVTVVDTPGWWKYFSAQYTPERVRTELAQAVNLGSKAPHALLLVVPSDVSFLEQQRKITEENMKMFGEMAWRHTLILFTWGDSLGNTSIEEHIENEGEALKWLVEKCGNRYHVFDNINRGDGSQVRQLLEKIDEMEASIHSCDLTYKAPTGTTESQRQEKEVRPKVVDFLDQEWNRRDKELEERITIMWQETFGSSWRGDSSMKKLIVFHENEVSSETTVEKRLPVSMPQAECSAKELNSPVPSDVDKHHGSPQTHRHEKFKVTFEREWGRCKAIIMDRVRGSIFPKIYASYEEAGQAEHEHPEQANSRMQEMVAQEWVRHEAVVMEKVQAIIAELCSQIEANCSEPDKLEIEESRKKVEKWATTTSGFGSEFTEEEVSFDV